MTEGDLDTQLYEELQEILDRHKARAVMIFILGELGSGSQDACIVRPDHEKWVLRQYEKLSKAWRVLFGQTKYGTVEGVVDGSTGQIAKLRAVRRIRPEDGGSND